MSVLPKPALDEEERAFYRRALELLNDSHVPFLVPAEEMIWSKALIQERERFDGADVIHLIRSRGGELDWHRLLHRFGAHWRVLLSHLILFGFVYPGERNRVPVDVMKELLGRLEGEIESLEPASQKVCFGPVLSREQYLYDVHELGYDDARLIPRGSLTRAEIQWWTDAIGRDE